MNEAKQDRDECPVCDGTGEVCCNCEQALADCECENEGVCDCYECGGTGEFRNGI